LGRPDRNEALPGAVGRIWTEGEESTFTLSREVCYQQWLEKRRKRAILIDLDWNDFANVAIVLPYKSGVEFGLDPRTAEA
jgi:hypothetical protein